MVEAGGAGKAAQRSDRMWSSFSITGIKILDLGSTNLTILAHDPHIPPPFGGNPHEKFPLI